MEAKAIYVYKAANRDELDFQQGTIIKIISEEDKSWYKAEIDGREGFVPANYVEFNRPVWYQTLSKDDAVNTLKERTRPQPEGAFVVRPSERVPGDLSITVKISGDVQHFKIMRTDSKDKYYLWNAGPMFSSVDKMIAHYRKNSISQQQVIRLADMKLERVKASYDFASRGDEELELKKGDVITVFDKKDPEWWNGQLERDGKVHRGLFPCNYVVPHNG